jgi:phospholipid/cholesterol/gamma-HCH transport system substrate-binding protein
MRGGMSGAMPRLGPVALVAQLLAALAFVAVLLAAEGVKLPFTGAGDWTVQAAFSDAGGIHTGEATPVLISGVPSGQVTNVRVEHGLAIVTMRLGPQARGVLRSDATAAIEPRSALEDMTIDLSPGSADTPAARPGMRIAAARTSPTITLDHVVGVMDADTRADLSILLDQLAHGTGGRAGQLRDAVARLHALLDPATQVAGALARRRVLLTGLVGSLAHLGQAAEQHDVALAHSIGTAQQTLAVTATRQSAVAASVRGLPATIRSLNLALERMPALAAPLAPTLSALSSTAAALPATLTAIRHLAPAAGTLLSAAAALARDGSPGIRAAASVLGTLAPTATALTPAIARIEPIVSAVNARRSGIAQLGEGFSGVLSTNDANGPILRGLGTFEPFNPADFGYPGATGAQKAALAAKAARALTLTCLHDNAVACLVRYLVPGLPGSVR